MIARDDPMLIATPDVNVRRPCLMRWWFALNRDDDSRYVNIPLVKLIQTTDVDWPKEEEDR